VDKRRATEKGTWVRLFHPPMEGKLIRWFEGLDVGDRVRVELIGTDVERGFIDFARGGRKHNPDSSVLPPQLPSYFRTYVQLVFDESVIVEKRSCGKVRLLSKHLSQKVFGPWPFLGEIPEKKNNQENFYWVSILTFPYKGFRVFVPGALLTFVFDRNPLMQI
jgi:hypothetical protein